jgi:DNA-binding transcriptional LysR family regulator
VRGHVAVGTVTACPSLALPGLLAGFHRDHPGVEITLSGDNSDQLLEALRTGHLDLALVGLAGPAPAGIGTQVVIDEPIVAAVSHADPPAARATIRVLTCASGR